MSLRNKNHEHWNQDGWDNAARTASNYAANPGTSGYTLTDRPNDNVGSIDLTYAGKKVEPDTNNTSSPIAGLIDKSNGLSSRITSLSSDVTHRVAELSSEVSNRINQISTDINRKINGIKQQVDNFWSEMQRLLAVERKLTEQEVVDIKNKFNDRQSKYAAALDAAQSYGSWTIEKRFDQPRQEETYFWIFTVSKPQWGIVPVWHQGQVGPVKNCHVENGVIVFDQPGLWKYTVRLLVTEKSITTPPGLGSWPRNYVGDRNNNNDTFIRTEVYQADATLDDINNGNENKIIARQTEQFGQKNSQLTEAMVELVHTVHCEGTVFLDGSFIGTKGAKLAVKVWGATVHAGAESTRVTVEMMDTSHLIPNNLKNGV